MNPSSSQPRSPQPSRFRRFLSSVRRLFTTARHVISRRRSPTSLPTGPSTTVSTAVCGNSIHTSISTTAHTTSTSGPTTASNTSSINYGCKVIKVLNICGKRVMYKVFCWGTPNKNPQTHLITHLKNLPATSTANYCKKKTFNYDKTFDKTQRQQIDNDHSGITYDISLMFIVIKIACEGMATFNDPVWYTVGPQLEYLVTTIKKQRNDVFHGELQITESDFLDKAGTLRQLLCDTLKAAQQRYSSPDKELNDEIQRVNTEIDAIINEVVGLDDLLKHCESILLQQFLKEAPACLKEITKQDALLDIMSFLTGRKVRIHVQNIFTKIKVVKGRGGGIEEDMEYTDLLTVAQWGSSQPQVVVVDALAGGGKTTLVSLVTAEWQQGGVGTLKGLHQYQLLLQVQCRDSHLSSFTDLLKHLLGSAFLKFGNLLPHLIKQCCILVMIDGLDERNRFSQELVTDILDEFKRSPGCTILCTTRPETLQNFLLTVPDKYNVTQVRLVGIPVELRTQFVCQYFKEILRVSPQSSQTPGTSQISGTSQTPPISPQTPTPAIAPHPPTSPTTALSPPTPPISPQTPTSPTPAMTPHPPPTSPTMALSPQTGTSQTPPISPQVPPSSTQPINPQTPSPPIPPQPPTSPTTALSPQTGTSQTPPVSPQVPPSSTQPINPQTPSPPITPQPPTSPTTALSPQTGTSQTPPVSPQVPPSSTQPINPQTPSPPNTPQPPTSPTTALSPQTPPSPTPPITPHTPTSPTTALSPQTPGTSPTPPISPHPPTSPTPPVSPQTPLSPTPPITPHRPTSPTTALSPQTPPSPTQSITPQTPPSPTPSIAPHTPPSPTPPISRQVPSIEELEQMMEREKDKEHFRLPLNLTMFAWLFFFAHDQMNQMTTQTELYHLTHTLCQDKLDHRLANNDRLKLVAMWLRQHMVKGWLPRLYKRMVVALSLKQISLPEDITNQLRVESENMNLPADEIMAAFLCLRTTCNAMGQSKEQYEAPHKGLQEHYGALHIVMALKEDPNKTIREIMKQTLESTSVNLVTFQNLLQQVAGLLHLHLGTVPVSAAKEVVDLLHEAGVEREDQWLDLLEDTKAAPDVLTAIATYFPVAKGVTITSGRLHSYSKLLPHLPATDVRLDVNGEPSALEVITPHLSGHRCTEIKVWHQYYHPHSSSPVPDSLNRVFSRGDLKEYAGQLNPSLTSSLPGNLTGMWLVVSSDAQASLLPALQCLIHLQWLSVHVTTNVSAAELSGAALPKLKDINGKVKPLVKIYLPDVDSREAGERAVIVAKHLQPPSGYQSVWFPRSSLDAGGWLKLMKVMLRKRVKVDKEIEVPHYINFTQMDITRLRLGFSFPRLGCFFGNMYAHEHKPWEVS